MEIRQVKVVRLAWNDIKNEVFIIATTPPPTRLMQRYYKDSDEYIDFIYTSDSGPPTFSATDKAIFRLLFNLK